MSAPKHNLNAVQNGTRLRRLTLGTLPRQMERVTRRARQYRRDLENLTFDKHGEVNAVQAHAIDAAVSYEVHASVCRWLLREKLGDMQPSDILQCSAAIPRAKADRNRSVAALGLDRRSSDPWDAVIHGHVIADGQSATQNAQHAAANLLVASHESERVQSTMPADAQQDDQTPEDEQ